MSPFSFQLDFRLKEKVNGLKLYSKHFQSATKISKHPIPLCSNILWYPSVEFSHHTPGKSKGVLPYADIQNETSDTLDNRFRSERNRSNNDSVQGMVPQCPFGIDVHGFQ